MAVDAVLESLTRELRKARPYLLGGRVVPGEAGKARLELMTSSPATLQMFQLTDHRHRLVMDIYPAARRAATGTDAMRPLPVVARTHETMAPSPAGSPLARPIPAPPPAAADDQAAFQEAWLEVRINDQSAGTSLVRRRGARGLQVSAVDLKAWRLRVPRVPPGSTNADDYYSLDSFEGLTYRLDELHQTLWITVPPSLFEATLLNGSQRHLVEPSPASLGAFLNYDASVSRGDQGQPSVAALLEFGAFGSAGNITNSLLTRQLADGSKQTLRLDTTWTSDQPASMASLRLGDAISGVSQWGRSVRFGGMQWASNFDTQPSVITFPMPALAGTAATPSTVDFYVNNALRLRRDVPSGPFDIQDLPVLTGQGQLSMVVRDVLGREQVITQPFYASSGLLAPGLRSYSYEVGFERRNYALQSDNYGPPLLVATERRGLSDSFTGELHAEIMPDQYTAGAGGTLLLSTVGVATFSLAGSDSASGRGATVGVGFDHQGTSVSYGMRSQWTTRHFAQLGYDLTDPPPRRTTSAYLSFGTSSHGSVGMNYTREDFVDQQNVNLAGLSYNVQLARVGYLSMSALRFLQGPNDTLFSLTFTRIFGSRDSASMSGRSQGASHGGSIEVRHSLPVDTGIGYGLQAGLSRSDPSQLDLSMQNDVGTYEVEAARIGDQDGFRGSARGSLVLLGDRVYASREIDDSFAVVQVPAYPNVRVYADNQPVATTDAEGYALVPRLRAYQSNPIRIEQADLPMDAKIDGLQLDVVPYRNSGVKLVFPVTRSRGALVTLTLAGGGFLPAGAEVLVDGRDEIFPVGERGEAYITNLAASNRLHVRLHQRGCEIDLSFPETNDPLPHLGPFVCSLE